MNAIQFNETDKSAVIDYTDLAKTMEIGDGLGDLPKQCPLQPGSFIVKVVDAVKTYSGLDAKVAPITIREPYCQVNRKKIKDGGDLEFADYIIKRLVTRVDIPIESFEGNDKMNASVALSYAFTDSVKGVQVAFGQNVHVCENLSTFGGFSFSTHGGSKVSFEEGMQLLNHWLQNLNKVNDAHIEAIEKLMKTKVARAGFHRIIGSLFEKAVRSNNKDKTIQSTLNQSQVSAMVQQGMPLLQTDTNVFSGWDIMNWGTNVIKANNSDMINVISDSNNFNNFLLNEFKIPFAVEI